MADTHSRSNAHAHAHVTRARIFTNLWYSTQAEEAAHFYASIFPDSHVDQVTPLRSESPAGPPGSVKVVDFTLFGQRFRAMTAGPHDEFNDAISMVVLCEDQAELDRYWDALRVGGAADACGWLRDRYGVSWQITPRCLAELMNDPDRDKARRTAEAMMTMVKLDIAALQAAHAGR